MRSVMQSCARGITTGQAAGGEPNRAVAAERVAEHDRVILRPVGLVDLGLQAQAHGPAAFVVETLGEELNVDLVG